VRKIPAEQLKHSGMSFMPDLTLVPGTEAFDPFYIVPVLGVLALNYQLKLSMKDLGSDSPNAPHVVNLFRVASPLMILFTGFFPAGLLLSIFTGMAWTGIQAALLRHPWVRQKLNLPRLSKKGPSPPSVIDTLKHVGRYLRKASVSKSTKPVIKARSKSS